MSRQDPTVVAVETGVLTTHYPRAVGRNAGLGHHGTGPDASIVIVRTDDGRAGWGLRAGPVPEVSPLLGRSLSELIGDEGVREDAYRPYDIALHDLLGVVADIPVAAILGGTPRPIAVYDGAIYFDDLDPDDAPRGIAALLAECTDDARAGHNAFKLKIGRGHRWMERSLGDRRDIEATRAVREAFPEAKILVDANDGYDLDGMCGYLSEVADVGLYWVEEPFADDAEDLAKLRTHLDQVSPATRIADGELDPDVPALLPVAAQGALQVMLMDVCTFGISRWRAVMSEVRAAGAEASPHAWGQPLKTLYAAHVAAGLGNVSLVEGVPGRTVGVAESAVRVTDGLLEVSDRPGFGLPLPDPSLVRRADPGPGRVR